jgi:hypothetical protein
MIPVDGDFSLSVSQRFSGGKAKAQSRIVGAISADRTLKLSNDRGGEVKLAADFEELDNSCKMLIK